MTSGLEAALLFSPLLLGFAAHGVCLRAGWLRALARPIDGGTTLGGVRLFGENKTYRGLVAVGLGTALGFGLVTAWSWSARWPHLRLLPSGPLAMALGFGTGVAAMLAELPNSLLKRRLGIGPGRQAPGLVGLLFQVLDQVDVLLGAWLVLAWVVRPGAGLLLGSVLFVLVAHPAITLAGYALGMRATWR